MFLIVPLLCTALICLFIYTLTEPGEEHLYRSSILSSAFGLIQYLILRSLMRSFSGTSAEGETGMLVATAVAIWIFCLSVGIVQMVMQYRLKPKRRYQAALGTQIILLLIVCYFGSSFVWISI